VGHACVVNEYARVAEAGADLARDFGDGVGVGDVAFEVVDLLFD
jgi:hypothetical protein